MTEVSEVWTTKGSKVKERTCEVSFKNSKISPSKANSKCFGYCDSQNFWDTFSCSLNEPNGVKWA